MVGNDANPDFLISRHGDTVISNDGVECERHYSFMTQFAPWGQLGTD
jgi:hypothetical protein